MNYSRLKKRGKITSDTVNLEQQLGYLYFNSKISHISFAKY